MIRAVSVGLLAFAVGACEHYGGVGPGTSARLIDAGGASVGVVQYWELRGGVTLRLEATGLPPGAHAVHVHTVGRCDPPAFTSAGAHWNPEGRAHGFQNPQGPHRGDLPNVTVARSGVLSETVTLPGASLAALRDADGAALVLHAAADDHRTDPSGNSGDRIACAVL